MSKIKKNLSLQTIYQVLAVGLPLITAPYLARVLGSEQLGIYSYTSSIVAYFSLLGKTGTVNYGTRSIASTKTDDDRNRTFSEIYFLQVITCTIAILLYAGYLLFFCRANRIIALLQGITLIGCITDITWLFWGVEDFQITVTRSIVVKILTVVMILTLIKKPEDLWLYTIIMLGSVVASNLVYFVSLRKYVRFVFPSMSKVVSHIKPNFVLFIPLLAMSVYHTMDKTMLGMISNFNQSGYYYNADRVVQIPLVIISGFGTVMLPRMSSLISSGDSDKANELFFNVLKGIAAVSIGMAFGVGAVAREFVPIFFGKGYEPCVLLMMVMSPLLLIKGLALNLRTQYLIPMKKEKTFITSVIIGAIVNLILNIILIRPFGALGACIATVMAELSAAVVQFTALKGHKTELLGLIKESIVYVIVGLVMILAVRLTAGINTPLVVKLLLEIVLGGLVYLIGCLAYWKASGSVLLSIIKKR